MKILIIGSNGQLGNELQRILSQGKSSLGAIPEKLMRASVLAVDIDTLDITNRHDVAVYLRRNQPDVVINCAAYTNVDACEENTQIAFTANAIGPKNLAMGCAEIGAKLLHVSTDYVFDGSATEPVHEYEMVNPVSVYGKTKLMGEEYVRTLCPKYFIVRTAWLYGYKGKNFVKTIVNAAKKNGSLKVVDDQVGNPTNAEDLAHHILKMIVTKEYGIYHCTGEGICSWYDFACEIVRLAKVDATVAPCTTDEFPRPAKRPAYSALENAMMAHSVGNDMRDWKDALACYFENWDGE